MAPITNVPVSAPTSSSPAADGEEPPATSHPGLTDGQVGAIAGAVAAFVLVVIFTILCVVHRRKERARLARSHRRHRHAAAAAAAAAVQDYEKGGDDYYDTTPLPQPPPPVKKPRRAKIKPVVEPADDEEPDYIPGGPKYPTYRAVPPTDPRNLRRNVW